MATAIGNAVTERAREANAQNFIVSLKRTLLWEIGALVVIFFLAFLLPQRPRTMADMAAAGVEVV